MLLLVPSAEADVAIGESERAGSKTNVLDNAPHAKDLAGARIGIGALAVPEDRDEQRVVADWPMFRRDAKHSNTLPVTGAVAQ